MRKRISALFLAMALILSLAACGGKDQPDAGSSSPEVSSPEVSNAPDAGACTGTGQGVGFGGVIKVEVTLSADKTAIESINVLEQSETESIGGKAIELLTASVVENQTVNLDAVSGATMASSGFLAAVGEAIISAGGDPDNFNAAVEKNGSVETLNVDVVVVGAGGAGMTAAISAAQAGADVVILEKTAIAGGNTSRSTGGMNAAKTSWQDTNDFGETAGLEKTLSSAAETYPELADLVSTVQSEYDDWKANGSQGYFDSTNLFILDAMVGGKGINNLDLVTTLAENSADAIDWLDGIGAVLHNVGSFGGASVKRIHRPVNDEGKTISVGSYLVPILEQACADNGVQIIYNAPVTEIIMDGGKAVGVKAEGYIVNAKSVILATGGFGADLEEVAKYRPDLDGFVTTNAAGATGDGIEMAEAVGAATVDMDQIQIHPTVEQATSALITEGLRGDGAILVNAEGLRFCDEVGTRDAVSAAELAQTDGSVYLIVDQRMVDASAVIQGYITKGYTTQGETPAELAKALGIPEDALTETMDTWNAAVAAKKDDAFGRTSFANPLDQAPYYAIKIAPGIHHTMGGVVISTDAQVLTADGQPIPGLYAAGEVTGGVHGANRLGGNAVADIVVFGRIAGESAAKFAK